MARYIDADGLIKKVFPYDVVDKKCYTINAKRIYEAIQEAPTADVVPRSEVEILKVRLEMAEEAYKGLSELYHTDTDALVEARRKTEVEVAREIFEEIETLFGAATEVTIIAQVIETSEYKALKKKYIPDTNDGDITAAEAIANFHEAVHEYYTDNNHCVVCGESVPEGRQVCGMCETGQEFLKKRKE